MSKIYVHPTSSPVVGDFPILYLIYFDDFRPSFPGKFSVFDFFPFFFGNDFQHPFTLLEITGTRMTGPSCSHDFLFATPPFAKIMGVVRSHPKNCHGNSFPGDFPSVFPQVSPCQVGVSIFMGYPNSWRVYHGNSDIPSIFWIMI